MHLSGVFRLAAVLVNAAVCRKTSYVRHARQRTSRWREVRTDVFGDSHAGLRIHPQKETKPGFDLNLEHSASNNPARCAISRRPEVRPIRTTLRRAVCRPKPRPRPDQKHKRPRVDALVRQQVRPYQQGVFFSPASSVRVKELDPLVGSVTASNQSSLETPQPGHELKEAGSSHQPSITHQPRLSVSRFIFASLGWFSASRPLSKSPTLVMVLFRLPAMDHLDS